MDMFSKVSFHEIGVDMHSSLFKAAHPIGVKVKMIAPGCQKVLPYVSQPDKPAGSKDNHANATV